MSSIFTKIINREIPAYIIAENDTFISFLDAFPIQKGHCLVVPKQETDKFFDLSDDLLKDYLPFARRIAAAIEKVVDCNRVAIAVVGLEVPHAHMHLIPINQANDALFSNPKLKLKPEEFEEIASKIRANL